MGFSNWRINEVDYTLINIQLLMAANVFKTRDSHAIASCTRYSPDVLRSNASDYPPPEDPALATEQEQEADDLTEAESEEKENESISSSEESDEELPVPLKRAPPRPDEKIENIAEESPPPIVRQSEEVESGASLPEEGESTSQN